MCGEDGFCFCGSRGRSQTPGLELPCSRSLPAPSQENGGEARSNSVSESPPSPRPLSVSPDSGETHSKVGLGMPGVGGSWRVGSGLSWGGGMAGLTQPLTPPA